MLLSELRMSENQNPNILPYYTSSFLVHDGDEYKKEGEKGKEEIRERKKKKKKRRGEGGGFIKIFFLFITREPPNQKSSLSVCVAQSSAASDVMS